MSPLCFSNDRGDEKHYIFHCRNPKLVEIRKTFIPEIYETFIPYPDVNSINDILHIKWKETKDLQMEIQCVATCSFSLCGIYSLYILLYVHTCKGTVSVNEFITFIPIKVTSVYVMSFFSLQRIQSKFNRKRTLCSVFLPSFTKHCHFSLMVF